MSQVSPVTGGRGRRLQITGLCQPFFDGGGGGGGQEGGGELAKQMLGLVWLLQACGI